MSILTIVFALLLSGPANFTTHTNSVSGGAPTTASQTSKTLPGMAVDDLGGGPVI
jgi:hypothetical protein